MKTSITGKVRIKFYWKSVWSSRIQPFSRIAKIGNLLVYKVVHPKYNPFSKEYYKAEVIEFLKKHFDIRWEKTPHGEEYWYSVYSKIDGGYVGTPEGAYRYYQMGLRDIQKAHSKHKVCSIGRKPKEDKWYGWSHRAMYGFKIGDKVKEGDCCASSGWTEEYLAKHPEEDFSLPIGFIAKNEDDTKKMAIAFAESVG
jgi:hypothetical protein